MSWMLVIVLTAGFGTSDYLTQIGPFKSEKSCQSAMMQVGNGVKNAKFYCFQVEKNNG
jgi:hypothetical protein